MGIINLDNIKEYRIYELVLYNDIFFLIKHENKIYRINFSDYNIVNNNKFCKLINIKNLNYESNNINVIKYKDILDGSNIEIKNDLININKIILSDNYKFLFEN